MTYRFSSSDLIFPRQYVVPFTVYLFKKTVIYSRCDHCFYWECLLYMCTPHFLIEQGLCVHMKIRQGCVYIQVPLYTHRYVYVECHCSSWRILGRNMIRFNMLSFRKIVTGKILFHIVRCIGLLLYSIS